MMNADVLGMTATEMRAGPPWDQNPKPRSFQLRARGGPSLCSTRTQAWGRKVIWTGADARTQQQQGQKTGGEQARPRQGTSKMLGHPGSLQRKSSEHRGAQDSPRVMMTVAGALGVSTSQCSDLVTPQLAGLPWSGYWPPT